MNHYELIYILPGTMTDDEAASLVDKVKSVIIDVGIADFQAENLGKNRLAYPIRHIRYGFFNLCRMQAEGEQIVTLEKKLGVMPELLRVFIKKYDPKAKVEAKINYATLEGKTREEAPEQKPAPVVQSEVELENVPVAKEPKVKKAVGSVSLEDIDEQLDKILEGGIPEV